MKQPQPEIPEIKKLEQFCCLLLTFAIKPINVHAFFFRPISMKLSAFVPLGPTRTAQTSKKF